MSLYHLMNGINPATFLVLPMLGEKHPDDWPRYRDCFIVENEIFVLTRVGSLNKNCGYGEDELRKHPNYLREFDHENDRTYGAYVFSIPDQWKEDLQKIKDRKFTDISEDYKQVIIRTFPRAKDVFKKILYQK